MTRSEAPPLLSVVATSRNDDHGGHLLERMQWFVDGLAWNAERRGVPVELVLIEWNPPADRAPLAEVLRWPRAGSWLEVRVLTVPAAEHRRLLPGGGVPMLQMIAKNVGIRRARGRSVLATNIDILLSPELYDLSTSEIPQGVVLRADRVDVRFPFAEGTGNVEEALEQCEAHPIRYARRDGIHYPGRGRVLPIYQGVGDFLRWQVGHAPTRLAARLRARRGEAGDLGPRLPSHRPGSLRPGRSLLDWAADRAGALLDLARLPKLHVNACGDFTLLARADWHAARGYPELVTYSMHLDTIFLHQLHAAGLRQVEAGPPAVAYHMEHSEGSGWTPEGQAQLFEALARSGTATLGSRELRAEKRRLQRSRGGGSILYNDADWGLASLEVPETVVTGR